MQKFFNLYQFPCCLLPSVPMHMGERSQLALVPYQPGVDLGSLSRIKNLPNPLVDKLESDVPSRGSWNVKGSYKREDSLRRSWMHAQNRLSSPESLRQVSASLTDIPAPQLPIGSLHHLRPKMKPQCSLIFSPLHFFFPQHFSSLYTLLDFNYFCYCILLHSLI